MYDYLAKIILLGPSGTGKYVLDRLKTKKTRWLRGAHISFGQVVLAASIRQERMARSVVADRRSRVCE